MTAPRSGPVPPGESADITRRQDEPEHLHRLFAYSHLYRVGSRWRRVRTTGTLMLATVGPTLSLLVPAAAGVVGTVGAAWLIVGRTVLSWAEQRATLEAVRTQELYDTELFHLRWNSALAGRAPSPEDVADAARHIDDDREFINWYSIELGDTPWPADVLLCQRQSMIWSKGDHRAYGLTILSLGITWLVVGLIVGLIVDFSLASYLVKVFLPSAPALLDSVEQSRLHLRHATSRQQVEHKIHDIWQQHRDAPDSLVEEQCREIQDAAYLLRRDGPRVPRRFYQFRKALSQAKTAAGATALRRTLPKT
ncbi:MULTISPECIES: S-4TM family putative pore-forming effector [unclassified Amycolatopsis]|uniref:S-4TM family putative pore-forming effector n=1 Tax=unclassified Amycolatopsis TaxID=2618356 RepID=UPI0028750668|nr:MULTISPECIES: S-4TM family putative pore-forming effector [unclassified Amycolatopsis]MDS0133204.1 hypothetical protein [Amycolatopsis sp. 505]MDS0146434.1 hypothetical protein [Amycolatopsis sp. CM201R]